MLWPQIRNHQIYKYINLDIRIRFFGRSKRRHSVRFMNVRNTPQGNKQAKVVALPHFFCHSPYLSAIIFNKYSNTGQVSTSFCHVHYSWHMTHLPYSIDNCCMSRMRTEQFYKLSVDQKQSVPD